MNLTKSWSNKFSKIWDLDCSKLKNAPKDQQKIKVHFVFAVKHDGYHTAMLIADRHLTREPNLDSLLRSCFTQESHDHDVILGAQLT